MTLHTVDFTGSSELGERYFAFTPEPGRDFAAEAHETLAAWRTAAAGHTPAWLRFHLSDPTNQAPLLRPLLPPGPVVARVGQPPVNGARLALEAGFFAGTVPCADTDNARRVRLGAYEMEWFATPFGGEPDSGAQTAAEFRRAEEKISGHGGTIPHNLVRTWLYCRDVDNRYAGLVRARREFFTARGLTPETHYIASTGIEGSSVEFDRLVRMDSLALYGHAPEQVRYLSAPDMLSPTHVYGVTFERGVRLRFGDRSHAYISGTASIDRNGEILHPGDVAGQTRRLLDNVAALLADGEMEMRDLALAVVYLRDGADAPAVEAVLRTRLPARLPRLTVRAAVCRPGWLVEMEAIAVNAHGDAAFPPLG